uniref:uncharacterized protein LOC122610973 n=1 Tax=Erigeron canadensis TaxID=72917 RepID=UPI001CB990C9|nr:uncharacterized protein LOC122610973 [Erigeron canadensis]
MQKRIGSTTIINEPFEWSNDSSLEVFVNVIESEEAESSIARSRAKSKVVNRNCWTASERLHRDYFFDEPKYDDDLFEERYRMSKRLFLKIVHDLESRYAYFQDSYDARLAKSFTPIQKCTSAIRQLATGNPSDEYNEYLEMAGRTSHECLQFFVTLSLTLIAPNICDLWIWHAFFGPPGALNDINVLQQSPLFLPERMGTAPYCPFSVNGRTYRPGYYLVDDIYLTWSTFVKAYKYPTDPKEKMFKTAQEAARKDIERAFGVLKGK